MNLRLPALEWLRSYDHGWLRGDVVAGITLANPPPQVGRLDLSAAPRVDMHSAHMPGSLADQLTAASIQVQAVEARSSVRERLRGLGVDAALNAVNRFTTVAKAVEAFQKQATN